MLFVFFWVFGGFRSCSDELQHHQWKHSPSNYFERGGSFYCLPWSSQQQIKMIVTMVTYQSYRPPFLTSLFLVGVWAGPRYHGSFPERYCADSGPKWCHRRKMAAPVSGIFWLHFCTVGGCGDCVVRLFIYSRWFSTTRMCRRQRGGGSMFGNKVYRKYNLTQK